MLGRISSIARWNLPAYLMEDTGRLFDMGSAARWEVRVALRMQGHTHSTAHAGPCIDGFNARGRGEHGPGRRILWV